MRGLNEIVPISDIFCSGLGAVERIEGNNLRLYFYVTQATYEGETKERVVVAKLVVPASSVPDALMRLVEKVEAAGLSATIALVPELTH